MSATPFDITCVLTCHAEGSLVHRTLRSLERARQYALGHGIRTEILVVMDRPSERTKQYFNSNPNDVHWDQLLTVDVGDAGLSRNQGVQAARGEYIAIMDADDLVCENWFERCYVQAQELGPNYIHHSHWIFTFGRSWTVWRQLDQKSDECFIGNYLTHNYWSALCFAPRSIFLAMPYQYADQSKGFGFEDMHWNCQTIARNYIHVAVADTVHFVRLKISESRNLVHVQKNVVIPATELFSPEVFPKFYSIDPSGRRARRGAAIRSHFKTIRHTFESLVTEIRRLIQGDPEGASTALIRRRIFFAFVRLNYYLFLRPIVKLFPKSLSDLFWGAFGQMASQGPLNRLTAVLPQFVLVEMRKISEIEPELFPTERQIGTVKYVPPSARETILAPFYARALGYLQGKPPVAVVIFPEKFSEATAKAYTEYLDTKVEGDSVLVVAFHRDYESVIAPKPGRIVIGVDYTELDEFAYVQAICRLIIQFAPAQVHLFSGSITNELMRSYATPIFSVSECHLVLDGSEDGQTKKATYSAIFGFASRFASIRLPDAETKHSFERLFGQLEGNVRLDS